MSGRNFSQQIEGILVIFAQDRLAAAAPRTQLIEQVLLAGHHVIDLGFFRGRLGRRGASPDPITPPSVSTSYTQSRTGVSRDGIGSSRGSSVSVSHLASSSKAETRRLRGSKDHVALRSRSPAVKRISTVHCAPGIR